MKHQAKLADFGGWEMPIEYPKGVVVNGITLPGGTISEHTAVRERVGIFDVSHLGKISIMGSGAKELINSLVTNDLSKIGPGQAQYNLMCNESGGVIDDLIVYEISDSELFLIPNAANASAVEDHIGKYAPKEIQIQNQHEKFAVLALQGPKSDAVLKELNIEVKLEYMSFIKVETSNFGELIICRTGYTGEFGYELIPTWNMSEHLWNSLVNAIAKNNGSVCGLGARDTLRTEMGYPLHGNELSLLISPVQASASWAVVFEKADFVGKVALLKEKTDGVKTVLRAIKVLDRGIPRAGMKVNNQKGEPIGSVTSGTFSPTLRAGVALALLSPENKVGSEVQIDIRGRISMGEIVKLPFVPSHVK